MNRPRKTASTPLRTGLGEERVSGGSARSAMLRSVPTAASETPSSERRVWIACSWESDPAVFCRRLCSSSRFARAASSWRFSAAACASTKVCATVLAIAAAPFGVPASAVTKIRFASGSTLDVTCLRSESLVSPGILRAAASSTLLVVSSWPIVASSRVTTSTLVLSNGSVLTCLTMLAVASYLLGMLTLTPTTTPVSSTTIVAIIQRERRIASM